MERLEEYVGLLDGLKGTLRNHDGDYYTVNEARLIPGSLQQPRVPIAIAAGGPRGLRLTAEVADAWITFGDTSNQDLSAAGTERIVRHQMKQLEQRCIEAARDPAEVDRIYLVGSTEEKPLASVAAFSEFLGRYEEMGFTDLVFHHPRPGDPVWDDNPEIVDAIAEAFLTEH